MAKKLLWVGDAVVSSGFARSTHKILETLKDHFDVHVLGLNYRGDPHPYPYPIYPCYPGGDLFGIGRLRELVAKIKPDVVVVQNDPWNFPAYLQHLEGVPVVGIVAVDGKNCKGDYLNDLATAVFWTEFGAEQAKLGGYTGSSTVIPLGVDLDMYHSVPRQEAAAAVKLPDVLAARGMQSAFIVGVVGRNQQRKRLDLTIEYFAEWTRSKKIDDAILWLHVAPTGEQAYDLAQLAEYYDIAEHVVIPSIQMWHGVPESLLNTIYNIFDVGMSTTQGEGFGLPCMEMMAAGVPQIVPDWAALGEITENAAIKVPCFSTSVTPNGINVVGGVADRDLTVLALDRLYRNETERQEMGVCGLTVAQQERYRWEDIGQKFLAVVERAS